MATKCDNNKIMSLNAGYGSDLLTAPMGAGKVFHVCQVATDTYDYLSRILVPDSDGVQRLYGATAASSDTAIQAALDACVANRNDYVICWPSTADYDLTAVLTMSKARVHFICPAGIGNKGMNNFTRIHQTIAATNHITVTADCVEIAGFFFKGYDGTAHDEPAIIYLSGTRWTPHIHDNFFGLGATAAGTGYGILADGACSHFNIHDNYFTNYAPALNTGTNNALSAFIGITSGSSTRGIIADNIMHTGVNTTVASGITNSGTGMIIARNYIFENVANGGNDAGVLTKGITTGVDAFVVDNRLAVDTAANAITGGTADHTANENWESENGGSIIEVV